MNLKNLITGVLVTVAALALWELFVKKLVVKGSYEADNDDDTYFETDD